MRFRNIRIDKVGQAKGEQGSFVVIRARRSRWCRSVNAQFVWYGEMAQNHIVVGMWDNLEDWFEVSPNYCDECGHPRPLCSFCREQAIYFLDGEKLKGHGFICSDCGEPYVKINEMDDGFLEGVGWPELEVGLYACCDGCECDHWH